MTVERGRITHGGAQSAASTKLPWKPPTCLSFGFGFGFGFGLGFGFGFGLG